MKFQTKFTFIFALVFLSSLSYVVASECSDAGYQCFDMSCSAGYEKVASLNCPSLVGNRPEVCCKEVIDLSREPKIILNKEVFQTGDFFQATFELPYSADCSYYFINPSGVEMQEGAGGCGINPSFSTGDITARLSQLFGSAEQGIYQLKMIADKQGYEQIVKTKDFQIIKGISSYKQNCNIENGAGTCQLLGKSYEITHKGCGKAGSSLDLTFTSDGQTESFSNVDENGELTLKNGIKVKIAGAPCSVYQINLILKKEGDMSITKEGTFFVMKDTLINLNNVQATIREISWALSGDTEPKVEINGNNAQVCSLKEGEECKLFYGAVTHPISKNLIIKADSIYTNENVPEDSGAYVTITKINELLEQLEPTEDTGAVEIPNEEDYACNGCKFDKKCYPFGYRKAGDYCSDEYSFVKQLEADQSCENNFQCSTNLCIDNQCISSGIWQKFLNWFKRLFG